MGTGCSRKTDRFSNYQKLLSKNSKTVVSRTAENSKPKTFMENNLLKSSKNKKKSDNSEKIVEKIKFLTSNSHYFLLKSGKKLRNLIGKDDLPASVEIIQELRLYVKKKWFFPLKINRKVRRSGEKHQYCWDRGPEID